MFLIGINNYGGQKMKRKSEFIAHSAIVAALYVVLTLLSFPFSYGMIQFRISEIMTLMAFYNTSYVPGLLVGCAVANMFGEGGIVDVIFGTAASAFAFLIIVLSRKIKNKTLGLFAAGLGPAISSFIIAFEMRLATGAEEGFLMWFLWIALGEFVVVELIGCPLFCFLRNKSFMKYIKKREDN